MAPVMSSMRLAEHLNLTNKAALERYLQGRCWKPAWDEYKRNYLDKISGPRPRGEVLNTLLAEIIRGEKHGLCKYSDNDTDKTNWVQREHAARLLFEICRRNMNFSEGLFYGKNMTREEVAVKLWPVYLRESDRANHNRTIRESGMSEEVIINSDDEMTAEEQAPPPPPPNVSRFGGIVVVKSREVEFAGRDIAIASLNSKTLDDLKDMVIKHFALTDERLLFRLESEVAMPMTDITQENWQEYVSLLLRMTDEDIIWFETVPKAVGEVLEHGEIAEERSMHPWRKMNLERVHDTSNLSDRYWTFLLLKNTGAGVDVIQEAGDWKKLEFTSEERKQWERSLIEFEDNVDDVQNVEQVPVTEFAEISAEERHAVALQEKLLDNTKYQRENEQHARDVLEIESSSILRMPGMSDTAAFKFWQPPGIVAIHEMTISEFGGGLLCDGVGLGKTPEFLALIQLNVNIRKNDPNPGPGKPTLIIAPHNILRQWQAKGKQFFPELQIFIYHSSSNDITGKLSVKNKFFNGNAENAKVVVVTAPKTWQERHGTQWVNTNFDLSGHFGMLAVDEAHDLGKEGSKEVQAIQAIRAPIRVAMTATPIGTRTEVFVGILSWLQPHSWVGRTWWDIAENEMGLSVSKHDDPFEVLQGSPARLLLCTSAVVKRYILEAKLNDLEKGRLLGLVFEQIAICRTQASRIPFQSDRMIGDSLPPKKTIQVTVKYEQNERKWKQDLMNLVKLVKHDAKKNKTTINAKAFRRLSSLDSSLHFFYLNHYMAQQCIDFRKNERTIVDLLKVIRGKMLSKKMSEDEVFDIPAEDDVAEIYRLCAEGSPKFRWLCLLLADLVVLREEKLMIFVNHPMQQLWLEKVLQSAGLKTFAWAAGVNDKTRARIQEDFNEKPYGTCDIIVNNYHTGCAGLDFQMRCRNMLFFDEPPTLQHALQAIGRIQRMGQERWMRLFRLELEDSKEQKKRAANIVKLSGVGLMTMMSHMLSTDEEEVEIKMGLHFEERDDGTIKLVTELDEEWADRGLSPYPEDPTERATMLSAYCFGSHEKIVQGESGSGFGYGLPDLGAEGV